MQSQQDKVEMAQFMSQINIFKTWFLRDNMLVILCQSIVTDAFLASTCKTKKKLKKAKPRVEIGQLGLFVEENMANSINFSPSFL